MERIRKIFENRFFILALQAIFSLATAVAAIFYIQASVIVIRAWKIALIDLTFCLSAAVLFMLCYAVKAPELRFPIALLYFFMGAAIFAAIFFPVQAILKESVNATVAATAGISIALAFVLGCLLYQIFPSMFRHKRWESILVAGILLIVQVGSLFLAFGRLPQGWAFKKFSNVTVSFETASAEELALTEAEKALNKAWYEENVLHAVEKGKAPAFDFSLGGKTLSESLSDWTVAYGSDRLYADGVESTQYLTNAKTGVEARVVSVCYDATATFEWTVYLKNKGEARSDTVSDFYALRAALEISSPTLYFSGGSYEKNDDFALYSKKLTKRTLSFDTADGRTSSLYLPFFNVKGDTLGATVGIGWSGSWKADFAGKKETSVSVSQLELEGYLEPEEEIRSPLVSLHFYTGNPLKGFNEFRRRVKDSLPEGYGPISTCFFVGAEGQDDTNNATEQGALEILSAFKDLGIADALDYAWFDAGWYDTKGIGHWNQAVGDWDVDKTKYPNGFAPVTNALHAEDVGFLLWYEPERIPKASNLYKEYAGKEGCESWLLYAPNDAETNCLWNFGDQAALDFMCKRIASSLKELNVDYYRQDFNINPGDFWKEADKTLYGGRKGFAENKYVVGEYYFLDYLTREIPGLLIDNCASGGRRLDLEMARRSIPLWRSDYNCYDNEDLSDACQYQTYGLSLWLPYSSGGHLFEDDVYDYRSHLGAVLFSLNQKVLEGSEDYLKNFRDYQRIKNYFDKQYYPLTPCTTSDKQPVALQFGDEKEGVILLYAREKIEEGTYTFRMNGLSAEKTYALRYIEGEAITQKNGQALLADGFSLSLEKRTAYIILYGETK